MRIIFLYAKMILGVELAMVGLFSPTIAGINIPAIVCVIAGVYISMSADDKATDMELGRG